MSRLPGLLLLHGVGDSSECWGPFVQRLRASHRGALADLAVSTPNAPAHGGKRLAPGATLSGPDQVATAIRHAEDLVGATGGPLVVGGHSMGSAVALALVAERPDLARCLWLEDPPMTEAMATDDERNPSELVDISEFAAWFTALQSRPLADVVAMARAEHPGWDSGEYEPWARAKQSVDVGAFAEPVVWVGAGWARRARTVTCPTVVVAGDPGAGSIVSAAAGAELAALPGWTVHRLPVGHDVRRDAPEEVVHHLAELIRSVGP